MYLYVHSGSCAPTTRNLPSLATVVRGSLSRIPTQFAYFRFKRHRSRIRCLHCRTSDQFDLRPEAARQAHAPEHRIAAAEDAAPEAAQRQRHHRYGPAREAFFDARTEALDGAV